MTTLVYEKSLNLTSASRHKSTTGEIVNLMAADSEKIGMMALSFNDAWLLPIQSNTQTHTHTHTHLIEIFHYYYLYFYSLTFTSHNTHTHLSVYPYVCMRVCNPNCWFFC